ncbi:hypothetical protein V6N13_045474 [Hibiscus sabdariffa]|uniref:Uncharacterized protein n=1 Tax=Hibiscus sabdariffa TaxID=183260 RepID=A0ABR2RL96_9ROSI
MAFPRDGRIMFRFQPFSNKTHKGEGPEQPRGKIKGGERVEKRVMRSVGVRPWELGKGRRLVWGMGYNPHPIVIGQRAILREARFTIKTA